jgi:hypothetical protein
MKHTLQTHIAQKKYLNCMMFLRLQRWTPIAQGQFYQYGGLREEEEEEEEE